MNIIEQKATDIVNHFMSKGAAVSKEDYDFSRNAMLEAMETVLEESVNEDTVWEDAETGEKSIFVSNIIDIINKYKNPKGNN